MTSPRRVVVALALVAAVLLPAAAYASQQKRALERQAVPVAQLPAAVTSGIQSAYPKATLVDAFKIARGADSMYEVTIKESPDGTPFLVMATPDGKVRSLARTPRGGKTPLRTPLKTPAAGAGKTALPGEPVVLDQLPKAVAKAIKDAYPKDTLVQAFKITTAGEITYELVLDDVSSVQPLRVLVSADGKIQKR